MTASRKPQAHERTEPSPARQPEEAAGTARRASIASSLPPVRPTRRTASPSLAPPAVLRPPRIGKGAQRFQEDHQVGLLARAEVQRTAGLSVLGVQADGIKAGVMPNDL